MMILILRKDTNMFHKKYPIRKNVESFTSSVELS